MRSSLLALLYIRMLPAILGLGVLSACGAPDPARMSGKPFDPYEAENRKMHAFNKAIDRRLVRPAGTGYSKVIPDDIETVIGNFAENLSLPAAIANNILQGNGKNASEDFYRFVVNTTIGLGGLFDTATELNMPTPSNSDFGKTLYVWGVHEGPYIELPLLGPSTTRAAAGKVVDLFTNPLSYALPSPERYYGTGASVSSSLSARGQYAATFDSVLYDSADSYAGSRSIYMQNRRYKLGNGAEDTYLDPYGSDGGADPYESGATGDPYDDAQADAGAPAAQGAADPYDNAETGAGATSESAAPYADPYEDPYAE